MHICESNHLKAGVGQGTSLPTSFSVPGNSVFNGPELVVAKWNLLPQSQQICLGLNTLSFAGFFGHVEVATSAGHPVRALAGEVWPVLTSPWIVAVYASWLGLAWAAACDVEPHVQVVSQITDGILSWVTGRLELRRAGTTLRPRLCSWFQWRAHSF